MTPQIVTLGNDMVNYYNPSELMGGDLFSFLKDTGKAILSPITSIGKGTGHMFAEAGRGISRGDFSRIALAPLKGVGHTTGSMFRDNTNMFENYWRPSKMGWMQPVGALVTAIGTIPGPHSPFMIPIGAGLTTAGTVGTGIKQKQDAENLVKEQNISNAQAQAQLEAEGKSKNQTMWWLIAGGGAVLAASYFL